MNNKLGLTFILTPLLLLLAACSHEHDDDHEHVVPQLVVDADAAIIIDIDPPLKPVTDEWDAHPSVVKQAVILEPADKEDHVITVTFSKPPLYVDISYIGPYPPPVNWYGTGAGGQDYVQWSTRTHPGRYLEFELIWNCGSARVPVWTP